MIGACCNSEHRARGPVSLAQARPAPNSASLSQLPLPASAATNSQQCCFDLGKQPHRYIQDQRRAFASGPVPSWSSQMLQPVAWLPFRFCPAPLFLCPLFPHHRTETHFCSPLESCVVWRREPITPLHDQQLAPLAEHISAASSPANRDEPASCQGSQGAPDAARRCYAARWPCRGAS